MQISSIMRWWRERHKTPPPSTQVPQEVKDVSHELANAVQVAQYHVRQAEKTLHPLELMFARMRNEQERKDDARPDRP